MAQAKREIIALVGPVAVDPEGVGPALAKFAAAAEALKDAGYIVQNPTDNLTVKGLPTREDLQIYMQRSIRNVTTAVGIALMPGWQPSPQASLEVYIACQLGIDCQPVGVWLKRAQTNG